MKTIALAIGEHTGTRRLDDTDTLVQTASLQDACRRLGHSCETVEIGLDLRDAARRLEILKPDVIFNLVESINGSDAFIALAPLLYESLGIPFTGSSSAAISSTTNKLVTKRMLAGLQIDTPAWQTCESIRRQGPRIAFPCILKSSTAHASLSIDDNAVFYGPDKLADCVESIEGFKLRDMYAEIFIDGREFNLSVLEKSDGGCAVLAPAEIIFNGFPAGKPRIVGYDAKWNPSSFEYTNTPRTFAKRQEDNSLRARLTDIASECFCACGLGGYARVDFRIDPHGRPFVLEINANPCLSPDAGFAAAAQESGIAYDEVISRIISAAIVKTGTRATHGAP